MYFSNSMCFYHQSLNFYFPFFLTKKKKIQLRRDSLICNIWFKNLHISFYVLLWICTNPKIVICTLKFNEVMGSVSLWMALVVFTKKKSIHLVPTLVIFHAHCAATVSTSSHIESKERIISPFLSLWVLSSSSQSIISVSDSITS
jgi:hypothetical protein